MRYRPLVLLAAAVIALAGSPALAAVQAQSPAGDPADATLLARATLPAYTPAPGPATGAFSDPNNGMVPPYPSQVVLGISSVLPAGNGSYWAMPDNGFGTKGNSVDFLLRLYHFTPRWETARGGAGTIDVGRFLSLRDPDHKIPFPIVNENTADRLLTGGDFDVEAVTRVPDGSMWIGDEFGPFLLHFDRTGKLLQAPVAHPALKAPQSPNLANGETPTVQGSRGYEALASSPDGRYLYPAVEGGLPGDDNRFRRQIHEFDTRANRYTGRTWQYRTDGEDYRIADMQSLDANRAVLIEREDDEGPAATFKRVYLIDRRHVDADGFLVKTEIADLLDLRNPALIGSHDPAGGYGLGNPFKFPLQSVEALLPLPGNRILVMQDNNFPDSTGRVPGKTDATEMIVIGLRNLGKGTTQD
ncbi:esterase-like activity of phytase family protein [Streptosporangium canum]|uniref:esterase-like activity of phytase family protein n=1 Tax=Streptosporangium canum TaxID=324952 RepID=UPI00344A3BB0